MHARGPDRPRLGPADRARRSRTISPLQTGKLPCEFARDNGSDAKDAIVELIERAGPPARDEVQILDEWARDRIM